MLGMELRKPDGDAASEALDGLLESLKDRGVLAGKTGRERNVLTFMPPLVITKRDLVFLVRVLEQVFKEKP